MLYLHKGVLGVEVCKALDKAHDSGLSQATAKDGVLQTELPQRQIASRSWASNRWNKYSRIMTTRFFLEGDRFVEVNTDVSHKFYPSPPAKSSIKLLKARVPEWTLLESRS